MLKKEHRLKVPARFGATFQTPLFKVKVSQGNGTSKFLFIVSKKVDKRATVRNRLRRLLRSCIEERLNLIRPGFNFVFIVKKEALDKERKDFCEKIDGFLKTEGYYEENNS